MTSRTGRYRRRRLTQRQRVNSYDGPDTVETGRCLLGRHTGRGLARLGRGWGRQEGVEITESSFTRAEEAVTEGFRGD